MFKKNTPQARSEHLQRVRFEHTQIFQAIKRGDTDVARAAMRLHLANSRERMRIALASMADEANINTPQVSVSV